MRLKLILFIIFSLVSSYFALASNSNSSQLDYYSPGSAVADPEQVPIDVYSLDKYDNSNVTLTNNSKTAKAPLAKTAQVTQAIPQKVIVVKNPTTTNNPSAAPVKASVTDQTNNSNLFAVHSLTVAKPIESNPVKPATVALDTASQVKVATPVTEVWNINRSDIELRVALIRWCRKAGWQLDWQVQGSFPIDFDWQLKGTFKQALNEVLKASQQSEVPLAAIMFNQNKVLRITSVGN